VAPTQQCLEMLNECGSPVSHIVIPNNAWDHSVFAPAMAAAFPDARIWAIPGLPPTASLNRRTAPTTLQSPWSPVLPDIAPGLERQLVGATPCDALVSASCASAMHVTVMQQDALAHMHCYPALLLHNGCETGKGKTLPLLHCAALKRHVPSVRCTGSFDQAAA
jgi:hypothetical protein